MSPVIQSLSVSIQFSELNLLLKDIISEIETLSQSISLNPERLDFVNHRLALLHNLSRKHHDENLILRLKTIAGVESQFYLLSDIGEAALSLPLESAFYWASTNNGDDNQLFSDMVQRCGGDFMLAFDQLVKVAPYGAKAMTANANPTNQNEGS